MRILIVLPVTWNQWKTKYILMYQWRYPCSKVIDFIPRANFVHTWFHLANLCLYTLVLYVTCYIFYYFYIFYFLLFYTFYMFYILCYMYKMKVYIIFHWQKILHAWNVTCVAAHAPCPIYCTCALPCPSNPVSNRFQRQGRVSTKAEFHLTDICTRQLSLCRVWKISRTINSVFLHVKLNSPREKFREPDAR